MRAIDADAFKAYMKDALEQTRNAYTDGGEWTQTITEQFCKDIDEQPTIEPEPQWIPCSKELPKIGDRVIGTYKNSLFENGPYVVRVMHREKKYWVGDDEHWFLYENIIAWKPLPEPYKEGGAI